MWKFKIEKTSTYSWCVKTRSKYGNILNQQFLKIDFQMVKIQDGIQNSPNHIKSKLQWELVWYATLYFHKA